MTLTAEARDANSRFALRHGPFPAHGDVGMGAQRRLLIGVSLVAADVAVTGDLVELLLHSRRGREGPWRRHVRVPAAWCNLTVLCNAPGIAFALLGMAVVEMERRAEPEGGAGWRDRLRDALA